MTSTGEFPSGSAAFQETQTFISVKPCFQMIR